MNILIADDSASIRRLLTDQLARHGLKIYLADSRSTAVREMARRTHDFLILDNSFPDGQGLDILKSIAAPAAHVLLFTTESMSSTEQKTAMSFGIERIFKKPGQTRDLVAYVLGWCSILSDEGSCS